MEQERTIGAAMTISAFVYYTGNVERISSQIIATEPGANIKIVPFTQDDFQTALRKVSKMHTAPIGENVRDAIKSIKGK